MTRLLRRLFGVDDKRGTLTFLVDGTVILGLPVDLDERTVYGIRQLMSAWLASGEARGFVLPFPVDVVDQRKPVAA